jgi:UDP-N-acetylmuramate--alanine ligase
MTNDSKLASSKAVHFIGIGGIGVSAIARMCLADGKTVTGSDRSETRITRELIAEGATIFYGQAADNVGDAVDLVVYTVAIPDDNPELMAARDRGIAAITYSQALGEVSKDKFTIAISGTHGKTTTTAMIAKILIDAGLDPTVIVGSLLSEQKSNFIAGKSSILVVEACEYKRSFHDINPDVVVITNVEADHLDYYRDLEEIQGAFKQFVAKLEPAGAVIANLCHESVGTIVDETLANVVDYSEISVDGPLGVPGAHNFENAKAALAVADLLRVDRAVALKALADFKGTWRRFERKGVVSEGMGTGAVVFDDYGHHPTEVKATLAGARDAYPNEKIVVVFQPHLYSRTKMLLDDFAASFKAADSVVLLPIYAAREPEDPSISSGMLAERVVANGVPAVVSESMEAAAKAVRETADGFSKSGFSSIIVTVGAGDVYKVADLLVG